MAVSSQTLNGLHFCNVGSKMRVVQVTDSGHITSNSCYPVEARIVLLCSDRDELRKGTREEYHGSHAHLFGGPTCV
eukprot:9845665-Karenia_brevis.AAC.1